MSTFAQIRSDLADIISDGTVGYGDDRANAMRQLDSLLAVAEAGRKFAEAHERFHPAFWVASAVHLGRCDACEFGKAFTSAYPQDHPDTKITKGTKP